MPETLYLIDGYAQIFRAYYAIRSGMHSPVTSEPTNAIFGFTGMLFKLFAEFNPHYVVVAIDAPGKTFRDDLYGQYQQLKQEAQIVLPPEEREAVITLPVPVVTSEEERRAQYKGTRNATPDDLTAQIPRIFEVIEGFGIPIIGQVGLEADDVIATIVQRLLDDPAYAEVHIRIVSKDKDLEQLIGDRVSLFDIHTDTLINRVALLANKGITPEQVIDMLALMGDTVDNIPGVEGIGPKTAAQLIQQYGSIEGIFAHIEEIKGKRRENLEKAQAHLPISRQLVTLERHADFPFLLEMARVRSPDLNRLLVLFRQLGFNRYQQEAERLAGEQTTSLAAEPSAVDEDPLDATDPFSTDEQPAVSPSLATGLLEVYETAATGDYEAITTAEQLATLVADLKATLLFSFDTETNGLGRDADLVGLSFAWKPGNGIYVPVRSPDPTAHLNTETVLNALRPVLEDPTLFKCGHNLKFDAGVLRKQGIRLRGVVFDSMLASQLLDPSRSSKLDDLAVSLLNYRMIPITDLIGTGEGQTSVDQVPLDQVTVYAGEDADIALRLYEALQPHLQAQGMEPLQREIEAPLAPVIAEMEANGILCDPEELKRQGETLGQRAAKLREEIQQAAGVEFRVESTQQLAEVLFDKLGFPSPKKTKTGRSTDITVLERLAQQEDLNDPRTAVPRLVIEYRQLTKLISTYLGNLRDAIDPNDGRIHTTFHQLVTATGRLASHNPNLQNIPVRTEIGRQIRKAFHAPSGHCLLCADYSQIELRLLAHYTEDPALVQAFAADQDIHSIVAAQVFHVPLAEVTREQRARAKTINFGIIYGITPYGLARRIEGMDVAAATSLIAEYKQRFPGIQTFLEQCVQEARDQGYVCTLTGRRRAIPEVHSLNRNTQALGERLAINSVIQGSAADLIKAAMVRVQNRIDRDRLPLKMLLQVHDELILETPEEAAEAHAQSVCAEMECAMTLRVPLRAEAGYAYDWMSAK
jgi:DNA polymerase-1